MLAINAKRGHNMTMSKVEKYSNNHTLNALPEDRNLFATRSSTLRSGGAFSGDISRPKLFPVLSQKWSMEELTSSCSHSKREICKQSDPTATETDANPYGKYTKMFAGLISSNSSYSLTKKRAFKKKKGSLVVCLS